MTDEDRSMERKAWQVEQIGREADLQYITIIYCTIQHIKLKRGLYQMLVLVFCGLNVLSPYVKSICQRTQLHIPCGPQTQYSVRGKNNNNNNNNNH